METVPEDLASEALHHTLALCQRGNCYDSAHAESFWGRFRAGLLNDGPFPGFGQSSSGSATTSPITTPNIDTWP